MLRPLHQHSQRKFIAATLGCDRAFLAVFLYCSSSCLLPFAARHFSARPTAAHIIWMMCNAQSLGNGLLLMLAPGTGKIDRIRWSWMVASSAHVSYLLQGRVPTVVGCIGTGGWRAANSSAVFISLYSFRANDAMANRVLHPCILFVRSLCLVWLFYHLHIVFVCESVAVDWAALRFSRKLITMNVSVQVLWMVSF